MRWPSQPNRTVHLPSCSRDWTETGPELGPDWAVFCDQELSAQLILRVPIKVFNPQQELRESGGSRRGQPDEASERRMVSLRTSRRDGGGRRWEGGITISDALLSHWLFGSKTLRKKKKKTTT